ncbi:hypothetical protein [Pacificibacter marinus]|nr:hypothetical protein [Pacificibacter marinus]
MLGAFLFGGITAALANKPSVAACVLPVQPTRDQRGWPLGQGDTLGQALWIARKCRAGFLSPGCLRLARLEGRSGGPAGLNRVSSYTIVDTETGRLDSKLSTILTLLNGLGFSLMVVPNHMAHRVKLLEAVELKPEAEEYLGEINGWYFDMDLTR